MSQQLLFAVTSVGQVALWWGIDAVMSLDLEELCLPGQPSPRKQKPGIKALHPFSHPLQVR